MCARAKSRRIYFSLHRSLSLLPSHPHRATHSPCPPPSLQPLHNLSPTQATPNAKPSINAPVQREGEVRAELRFSPRVGRCVHTGERVCPLLICFCFVLCRSFGQLGRSRDRPETAGVMTPYLRFGPDMGAVPCPFQSKALLRGQDSALVLLAPAQLCSLLSCRNDVR